MSLAEIIALLLNMSKNGEIDILSALKLQDLTRNILTTYSTLDIIVAQIKSLSPNSTVVSIDQLKLNIINDLQLFLQSRDTFLVFYAVNSVFIFYMYQGYAFILTIQSEGIILQTTVSLLLQLLQKANSTSDLIVGFQQFKLIKMIPKPNGMPVIDYNELCIKQLISL